MEKDKVSTGRSDNNNNTGKVENTEKKKPKKKMKKIIFRQNRKFDLHIGRKIYVFRGTEEKELSEEELNHPDFLQVSHYFTIKGA